MQVSIESIWIDAQLTSRNCEPKPTIISFGFGHSKLWAILDQNVIVPYVINNPSHLCSWSNNFDYEHKDLIINSQILDVHQLRICYSWTQRRGYVREIWYQHQEHQFIATWSINVTKWPFRNLIPNHSLQPEVFKKVMVIYQYISICNPSGVIKTTHHI